MSPIVVAMSGGVDSSVAAMLLKEQGQEVIGISMQVWDYRKNGGCSTRATCCSPEDFGDARMVAGSLGIPFYVFDFEESFGRQVIQNFVEKYKHGLTPNPCVDCNNKVKFRELRSRAHAIGCRAVATGHYARISKGSAGYHLLRGKDENKDQSYFLYGLSQQELGETLFPVGEFTKPEVREMARRMGLSTADKPESQDICFVSGSVQDFLVRLGARSARGEIVRRDGSKVGEHEGIANFTVGQRRGLNLGGLEEPFYVLELDAANNRVIVGKKEELERSEFWVGELNWVAPKYVNTETRPTSFRCLAQLRHRAEAVEVQARLDGERMRLEFVNAWSTVSPGQAAVLYDLENEEVLGGGRIDGVAGSSA